MKACTMWLTAIASIYEAPKEEAGEKSRSRVDAMLPYSCLCEGCLEGRAVAEVQSSF